MTGISNLTEEIVRNFPEYLPKRDIVIENSGFNISGKMNLK